MQCPIRELLVKAAYGMVMGDHLVAQLTLLAQSERNTRDTIDRTIATLEVSVHGACQPEIAEVSRTLDAAMQALTAIEEAAREQNLARYMPLADEFAQRTTAVREAVAQLRRVALLVSGPTALPGVNHLHRLLTDAARRNTPAEQIVGMLRREGQWFLSLLEAPMLSIGLRRGIESLVNMFRELEAQAVAGQLDAESMQRAAQQLPVLAKLIEGSGFFEHFGTYTESSTVNELLLLGYRALSKRVPLSDLTVATESMLELLRGEAHQSVIDAAELRTGGYTAPAAENLTEAYAALSDGLVRFCHAVTTHNMVGLVRVVRELSRSALATQVLRNDLDNMLEQQRSAAHEVAFDVDDFFKQQPQPDDAWVSFGGAYA